jgi:hypothetical protein
VTADHEGRKATLPQRLPAGGGHSTARLPVEVGAYLGWSAWRARRRWGCGCRVCAYAITTTDADLSERPCSRPPGWHHHRREPGVMARAVVVLRGYAVYTDRWLYLHHAVTIAEQRGDRTAYRSAVGRLSRLTLEAGGES